MSSHPTRRHALAISASAVICGAGFAQKARAAAPDQVTFMFDWIFEGLHAPFFYGIEKGIFRKHNIDLKLLPGTGSRNASLATAAGHTMFAMVDATVLPQALQQGADLKVVYCYMPTTPFGICFKKSSGIKKASDLEGRKYGDSPGTATFSLWSLFLRHQGADPAKVKLINISPSAQWAAFRSGQFDATYTAMNNSYVKIHASQPDVSAFAYSDYGFNVLSKCFVVKGSTLKNGDLIARFNAAFTESLNATQSNMGAAVDALLKQAPIATPKDQQIAMLQDTFGKRLRNENTKDKPLGWMAEKDWAHVLQLTAQAIPGFKPIAPFRIFTNEFIHA